MFSLKQIDSDHRFMATDKDKREIEVEIANHWDMNGVTGKELIKNEYLHGQICKAYLDKKCKKLYVL